jgi:hypothetical protein
MSAPAFYRLVTLEEAKRNVSELTADDDVRLGELVIEASPAIMELIEGSPRVSGWTDTSGVPLTYANGDPQRMGALGSLDTAGNFVFAEDTDGEIIEPGISIVPGPVQRATKALIAHWDDNRDGGVPPAVFNILAAYIDPPVA